MAVDELSKKNPDGTRMGQSSSDVIAFYGATPVAQQTAGTSNTIVVTNTSRYTASWQSYFIGDIHG